MVAAATRVPRRPARGMDEVSSPPHPQPGVASVKVVYEAERVILA